MDQPYSSNTDALENIVLELAHQVKGLQGIVQSQILEKPSDEPKKQDIESIHRKYLDSLSELKKDLNQFKSKLESDNKQMLTSFEQRLQGLREPEQRGDPQPSVSSLKSRPTTTEESLKKSSQPSYKAEDKTKGSLSAEQKVFEREPKVSQGRDPLEQDQDSLYQQFSQDQMRHDPYDIQNRQASSNYQQHSKFLKDEDGVFSGSKKQTKDILSSDMDDVEDDDSEELDQIDSELQSPSPDG